ncbi:MAG: hypothetical protein Q8L40_03015, partial [Burkholderiales bacterium]|nr:hypothetical protein [Burkholderiales bacterium]
MLIPRSAVPGNLWPVIPEPVGASMLAMQFQFEQSQWWPPDVIRNNQTRQIRLLLDHAVTTVPYYGKLLGKGADEFAGIDSDEWRQIPLLRRSDIQAAGDALLSNALPPAHGRRLAYQSSGSTGQPIKSYGSEITMFFIGALNLRDHLWHGRDLSAKVAAIRSKVTAQTHPGWGAATDVAFDTGPLAALDIVTDVEAQLQWLVQQDPVYLLTSPPNALELARLSLATGVRPVNLREVRTFGETLPQDLRMTCRKAWGVPVTDIYSAEEAGAIALQCPEYEHYHVQEENLLVEILDEQGRPCRPGETGRVVITTLHNFAMPLVRYENGDYAEVGGPCPCGRGLMV